MMRFSFYRLSPPVKSVIFAGSKNLTELQRLRQVALNIAGLLFIAFMILFILLRLFQGHYLIAALDALAIGFTILAMWIAARKNFDLGVWLVGSAAFLLTFSVLYQGVTPPVYRLPQMGLCMVTIMLFFNRGSYRIVYVGMCLALLGVAGFSQGGGLFISLAFLGQMIVFAVVFFTYIYFFERQDTALNKSIHELKESNNKKNEANHELNERVEELVVFSHIMSHDLKGPLTAIKGYTELMRMDLEEGRPASEFLEHIEGITTSADAMNSLISDLLTYAKVSLADVTSEAIELREVIREVTGLLRYQIEQSNADIQVERLHRVAGQADMLRTVFYNLLSNALKFQPKGCPDHRPCIRVSSESTDGMVSVFLRDNGIGISAKYLPDLFTPFRRGMGATYSGSGLGMSICLGIVEKFGGTIEVKETSPKGTTFKMTLPRADSVVPVESPKPDSPGKKQRPASVGPGSLRSPVIRTGL